MSCFFIRTLNVMRGGSGSNYCVGVCSTSELFIKELEVRELKDDQDSGVGFSTAFFFPSLYCTIDFLCLLNAKF